MTASGQNPVCEQPDVLIIGAGLSGIGAAVHLLREAPGTTFTLLEARDSTGGTWDLFRYPGIRSDSDMYTLGYEFKPWRAAKAIADGPSILNYVRETAQEQGIVRHIRTQHRVLSADWSAKECRWTVEIERGPAKERLQMKPRFLLFCAGYYRYDHGHRPRFPDEERFAGQWVHPQFWPEGLDCSGRRVVVIGSGATGVTLVPELARTAAHVTLLQRSPSYMVARPSADTLAELFKCYLPPRLAYGLVRIKNIALSMLVYRLFRSYPERAKALLIGGVRKWLGSAFDAEQHFTPHYMPWDQRLCLVPDGDLFKALRAGRASVVTDHIESVEPDGIRLRSGQVLKADVLVTATGLELNVLGDVKLSLDGNAVKPAELMVYKGVMFSGLPNVANTFGYTNASWTLKADLTARYFCRVLRHMRRRGYAAFTPQRGEDVVPAPFLDFSSGYVQRAIDKLPKQGCRQPWRLNQNYLRDVWTLRFARVADRELVFQTLPQASDQSRPLSGASGEG